MTEPEIWYFEAGRVMFVHRTDTGFIDVVTGAYFSKHEFMQLAQALDGIHITKEALKRIQEGERFASYEEDR